MVEYKKYSLFIGRWQPFHNGHKFIVDRALSEGKNVCIGIRDTPITHTDPYSVEKRIEMIRRIYGDSVKIITIPDIESINIGRNVGYGINFIDVPDNIKKISGTNIRKGKKDNIPKEVNDYIDSFKTTILFTGLPCSGKTSLATRLKEELDKKGYRCVHLDGDYVRKGLNKDLGFSEKDRHENLRRIAHVAKLFNDNGNLVIASFVSPTNKLRDMMGEIVGDMKLIYVKCRLDVCEKRDKDGLYKKARNGKIKEFTGISAPFEEPEADVIVNTEKDSVETCVKQLLKELF